jgi:hypothetical protein
MSELKSELMIADANLDRLEDELTFAREYLADAYDLAYWALVQCTKPIIRARHAELIDELKHTLANLPSKVGIVGAMQERDGSNGEFLKHAQIDLDSWIVEDHDDDGSSTGSSVSHL